MFKLITHRPLWINIFAGLLLAIGIFLVLLLSLKWLTHHGRSKSVPSVVGKQYEEAKKDLRKIGFDVEIQDSIYIDTLAPMVVIKQIPDADEIVKESRTVYLTINRAVPPVIPMPNLVGYSYRNAEMTLKNSGLRVGDTTSKPDFAKNSVLEQWYNGSMVAPGKQLPMGSAISLVLGDGVGSREFAVPDIIGMRFADAKSLLESYGISFAVILPNLGVTDTANAYIFWQNPQRYDEDKKILHIRSGQTMDVKLQLDKPARDTTDILSPQL